MNKHNLIRWYKSEKFLQELGAIVQDPEKLPIVQKFLLENTPPPSIPKFREGWTPKYAYFAKELNI